MPNKLERRALNEAIQTYRSYRDSHADAIENSKQNMDFVLGDQWSDTAKRDLDNKDLPYDTKNLILPIINRIAGMEVTNQTDMVVSPTEGGMDDIAWAMTRMNYFFKIKQKLNFMLSRAFVMGVISDMGVYIRQNFTTAFDPLGEIRYCVVNGANVLRDPMAREYDLSNDKRVVYTTWWTQKDAINHYPQKTKELSELKPYKSNFFSMVDRKAGRSTDLINRDQQTLQGGRYRVIEMWEKREKNTRFFYVPFEERKFQPKGIREIAELKFHRPNVIERNLRETTMHVTVTIADNILLFSGEAPVQNGRYPFLPFYAYHLDGDFLSIVNNLKNDQEGLNKRSTAILHILMSTANNGWMVDEAGITSRERFEQDSSGLAPNIYYRGGRPPEKIQANSLPGGLFTIEEQYKQGLYETSGIGPNLLGRAENSRESGTLFNSRVEEGSLMMQTVFANYAQTKELIGEGNVWYYQNKFSPERIFSILQEESFPDKEPVTRELAQRIAQDMRIGKYNVAVESVAKASTARQNTQQQVANLTKFMPPELVNWPEIVRFTDLEPEVKEKMAAYAEQRLGVANNVGDQAKRQQLADTLQAS